MKKRISLSIICCALIPALLSGCANYDDVNAILNNVTVDNIMVEVTEDASYKKLTEIDDLVYEEQLAACIMYADTYKKTYYKDIATEKHNEEKVAYLCNKRRHEINTEIEIAFAINIYRLLQDVRDCSNPDAYVVKTHKDVLDFFDIYDRYLNGENPEETLVDMAVAYHNRSNILALTFLGERKTEVCRAALKEIRKNAANDKDLRVYINLNNDIITALNTLYGSVPRQYADDITDANIELGKKLLLSLETISDEAKLDLLEQLATPSPEPTATPKPTPTAQPTPKPTPKPTNTPRPTFTPRPVPTKTPAPSFTEVPTEPEPTPYEPIFE